MGETKKNKVDHVRQRLDEMLQQQYELRDVAGLAASVRIFEGSTLAGEGMIYRSAFGYKNVPEKTPLRTWHVFHCASISKTFVGTGVMKLAEEGRLSLDDRVTQIIPEFIRYAPDAEEIRIRHMLSHTSGMGDVSDYRWQDHLTGARALESYVTSREVLAAPMLWSPEENKFSYSNIAYEMLGLIIQRVSGKSFEEYMRTELMLPSGMTHSTFYTPARTSDDAGRRSDDLSTEYTGSMEMDAISRTDMAMPHKKDENKHIVFEEHYPYTRTHAPSSTLTSTLEDMESWAQAHIERRLLRDETYETFFRPVSKVPNNGEDISLTWFGADRHGYRFYGHEGSDDGFRSSFWFCPELRLSIVLLSNMSGSPVKKISKAVFTELLEHLA